MSVYRQLYSILCYVIFPVVLLRLFWRSRKRPPIRQHWQHRLGFISLSPSSPRIWLHAVSVGETIAAKPLIESLLLNYPNHKLLITNTTATGYDVTLKSFGNRVEHCYFPYDLNGSVSRFLKRAAPSLLIIMETEIWPNLLNHCKQSDVPVIIANARLSNRSTKKYSKILPLIKETLSCVTTIACRSNKDSENFQFLGVSASQTKVTGNIKFDLTADINEKTTAILKNQLDDSCKIWVAASTHLGEDELLLDCFSQLKKAHQNLILVLVPRHPERFNQVFELCKNTGYVTQRRSAVKVFTNDCEIILGDSMGEMSYWLASADIVFLGGSLVETGGHNPLEATIHGVPVVSGPAIFNFDDVYEVLCEANTAWIEKDATSVTTRIADLLGKSNVEMSELKMQAKKTLQGNKGATDRLIQLSLEALS